MQNVSHSLRGSQRPWPWPHRLGERDIKAAAVERDLDSGDEAEGAQALQEAMAGIHMHGSATRSGTRGEISRFKPKDLEVSLLMQQLMPPREAVNRIRPEDWGFQQLLKSQ